MSGVPHHSEESDHDEDSRVEVLLSSIDQTESSLPARMLNRIKQIGRAPRSAPQGTTAASMTSNVAAPRVTAMKAHVGSNRIDQGTRKMFVARTFVSISAVVVFGLATVMFQTRDSQASLGDILDDVVQAESLQLTISRDGDTAEVWLRKSGDVRWQSPGKQSYLIARGSRLWRIDEAANTARTEPNPWQDETTKQVDLLAMIGLRENAAKLRDARAVGRRMVDGVECHVFRAIVKNADRELLVEAFADIESRQLRSIACWANGDAKRTGPPIAELKLVARNAPVDEAKFVVAKSLTEDGRIGKIVQRQGVVTLKPLNAKRWTPVVRNLVVKPGDWIRTGRRGANAVAVTLEAGHRVTLGPATLVEFTGFDSFKIHGGDVQVVGAKQPKATLNMHAGNKQHIQFGGNKSVLYRVLSDGKLMSLADKPMWLRGFEGSSANESLGSLIANAKDGGESLKLSIGYHKVSVEIRDQIARTTIEESFKNNTGRRLEGVFHFPLPQDASISGFGMWINNELVEADVVEKQRAREIYEAILRQKKDPALLEWTGGNIFKARVFPIEAHSEKRVRIVYTQVLPLRANRYSYSYGLRSEMLQTTPLRELSINVTINSAIPLKSVHSPTHQTRTQITPHSARLEFEEQEYTPTRDFEVVCEVDARQSDVVVVPHRRGDDGYFMVQLTPPSPAGNWQRELLPDGEPLELLLVCDTSGSMDSHNRALQSEFVSAVLASLGDDDRFNVAVADVDCTWLFGKPVSVNKDNVERAQQRLADRPSLGWTDLDRTFASIQPRVGKKSHVIYIGDGVVSARDADPQAFVARLDAMYDGKTRGTFHAVSVGSSFESVVLRAIARLGGGSVRSIDGEQTPERVALELLNEIAQPGLRDIKVEFRGLQVAAVYPERLPNLAAGTQQILLGRYLPTGADQAGEIVVSGKRGDESVRYSAKLNLADAEHGNSFVPRLWARSHLDHLLDQGANAVIKDEIIGLSEEFHIITPYTSLLVLESDEQREEFGVKRRYGMRDGERFFADGRDNANFELRQQQMKAAGDWRIGLRQQILRHLTTLGRDPRMFQQHANFANQIDQSARQFQPVSSELSLVIQQTQEISSSAGSFGVGGVGGSWTGGFAGRSSGLGGGGIDEELNDGWDCPDNDFDGQFGDGAVQFNAPLNRPMSGPIGGPMVWDSTSNGNLDFKSSQPFELGAMRQSSSQPYFFSPLDGLQANGRFSTPGLISNGFDGGFKRGMLTGGFDLGRSYYNSSGQDPSESIRWVSELFPRIPARPTKLVEPKRTKWPAEAVRISRGLLRAPMLAKLEGGLEIRQETHSFDPRWKREAGRSSVFELFSTQRWLQRPTSTGAPTIVGWADTRERGLLNASFLLGQSRKSYPEDLTQQPVGSGGYVHSLLHVALQDYEVEIVQKEAGVVTLICTQPDQQHAATRILEVDMLHHVILEDRTVRDGRVLSKTIYGDFVEAGSVHWPTKIEVFDDKGRVVSRTTQSVKLHDDKAFLARFASELDVLNRTQVLRHPLPSVSDAESAAVKDAADFEDRMVLLLRAALVQKWDTVLAELAAIEKLAADKRGVDWIKASVLASARKHEDARQAWMRLVERLLKEKSTDLYLPRYVIGKIRSVADSNEALEVVEQLKPIFERQPAYVSGIDLWHENRRALFEQLGRTDDAIRLFKLLAESAPWDMDRQTRYARFANRIGEHDFAFKWLRDRIDGDAPWLDFERNQFRQTYYDLLHEQGRVDEAVKFMEEWITAESTDLTTFGRYLVSLVHADRAKDADAIALKWMKAVQGDGQVEIELKGRPLEQLNAAVDYATGNRVGMYVSELDDTWFAALSEVARSFMNRKHNWNIATNLMWSNGLRNSDEADELRKLFAERLKTHVAEFDVRQTRAFVNIIDGHTLLSNEEWQAIINVLLQQRAAAKDDNERDQFESTILPIYRRNFADTKFLPFMRQRIVDAAKREDSVRAALLSTELFNTLIEKPWNSEFESELFGLIEKLSSSDSAAARSASSVAVLHRVVDSMIQKRVEAERTKLQDTGHPEKLTRAELAEKYASFLTVAREALAKRLDAETKARDGELAEWCRLERVYLDMQLDRKLKTVEAECWRVLAEIPVEGELFEDNDADPADVREQRMQLALKELRRDRAMTTLMNLATRKSASKASVAKLLTHIDQGIKVGGNEAHEWKVWRFQMLIALDRPDDLATSLRQWIARDSETSHWRRTLARLEAERGRFAEAMQLVRANERESILSPSDHALLARWRLVLNDRDGYVRSRIATLKALPEYQLNNWINQKMRPWYGYNNQPVPTELDEDVLFAFQALFEKSANPADYLSTLRQSYAACRDFRLLKMLPDAVLGRTPQQVYAFLQNVHSSLLSEVRNEATADEIMARIKELRASHEPSTIDKRALDLLECLVERRSAEVQNQPGPHADAAVAALKRAFKHELADGELRQMAAFLDGLGRLKQQALIDEQLRQLRDLHLRTKPGTDDHVHVSWHLANTIFWRYNQRTEGLALMQVAILAYEQTHADGWPGHAEDPINGYVGYLEALGQVAAGERFLKKHIAHPLNEGQRFWFMKRLNRLYRFALSAHASVSLGSEAELLRKSVDLMLKQTAEERNDAYRYAVLDLIPDIFDTAHREKVPSASEQYRTYAFEQLPPALRRLKGNYENVVRKTAESVKTQLGVKQALEFLIGVVENYPERFNYTYQSAWRTHASRLAEWRKKTEETQALGDLSPRLLAIVIKELKRDLRMGTSHTRYLYGHHGYQNFWSAKAADFKKAAEEVLKERSDSIRTAMHVARYIYGDLSNRARAIEILSIHHSAKKLNPSQQTQLVRWLQDADRHGETISILEPLVAQDPDSVVYRVYLITAYARTDRPTQTQELIVATNAHFRAGGRWVEDNISILADCLFKISRFDRAINYYNELIPLYQRKHPHQGLRSHTLSHYYEQLSQAHSALGNTRAAMDAASSAVLLWNKSDGQRDAAMINMQVVLNNAKDLDKYIQHLDEQAQKTGTDSPMLRRMCGIALSKDGVFTAAVVQLQLALQLDPLNQPARVELIKLLDRLQRKDEAITQLMLRIDIERHNLELYTDLVKRTQGDDAWSERALTSIVESAPTEHTHHQKAAELRQGQNRWGDAIMHWQQVAKLQAFEPTGLLGLAEAQFRDKRMDEARRTVDTLKSREWPSRFRNVEYQIRTLDSRLKAANP